MKIADKNEMPTAVGIFIFLSRENFMLSWVEHKKSFITLGTAAQTILETLYREAIAMHMHY